MNKLLTTLMAMLLAISLFGCGPLLSENPLSNIKKAKPDKQLLGQWIGTPADEDDVEVKLSIKKARHGQSDFIIESREEREGKEPEEIYMAFKMFPTALGKSHFLNLKLQLDKLPEDQDFKALQKGYIFMRYEISKKGKLSLWIIDDSLVGDAIEAKELEGSVSKSGWSRDVFLRDSTKAVAKYFKENGDNDELYELWATFEKAKK